VIEKRTEKKDAEKARWDMLCCQIGAFSHHHVTYFLFPTYKRRSQAARRLLRLWVVELLFLFWYGKCVVVLIIQRMVLNIFE